MPGPASTSGGGSFLDSFLGGLGSGLSGGFLQGLLGWSAQSAGGGGTVPSTTSSSAGSGMNIGNLLKIAALGFVLFWLWKRFLK